MAHPEFLYPVAAMVLLTFVVMFAMLKERIREMTERRIHPQSAPSSSQLSAVLKNTKGADNYKNLFEFPTLFYVLCLILMFTTKTLSPVLLGLAWVYVTLRSWHSFVHVGYNKVMTRFKIFLASCIVLLLLWIVAIWQLV
ncbi:MAG: hypothetical protein RLY82_677 [Pseudomonadota bacterium]|jgi:hypothetical protein